MSVPRGVNVNRKYIEMVRDCWNRWNKIVTCSVYHFYIFHVHVYRFLGEGQAIVCICTPGLSDSEKCVHRESCRQILLCTIILRIDNNYFTSWKLLKVVYNRMYHLYVITVIKYTFKIEQEFSKSLSVMSSLPITLCSGGVKMLSSLPKLVPSHKLCW